MSECLSRKENLDMFKAYDIRTREELLSPEMKRGLIDALAVYFIESVGSDTVVLGRDARLGVTSLMQMAIDVFPLYGLNVVVNPLQVSTCQFYYSCMQNLSASGIMFTASHNPGSYVGLKVITSPMIPLAMGNGPDGGIKRIKELYCICARPKLTPVRGKVYIRRYLDSFIDYSMKIANVKKDSLSGLRVLTDFLCGAAGTEVSEALSYAGADIVTRNLVPDGRFPIGDPNPIVLSSIKPTWDLIKKGGFDFGLAFDGDGDRMDLMASDGTQLAPSFNFSVLIPSLRELFKPLFNKITVYSDVKVNPLAQALQARNAVVRIIRNGHSFIKEALREGQAEGCVAACEESAHYYMNFPLNADDLSQGLAATENTLFFSLLTSRLYHEDPSRYTKAMEYQNSTYREREWPVHFNDYSVMEKSLFDVTDVFRSKGLAVFERTPDGRDLDSTLMRSGIPEVITSDTNLNGSWFQIAQRISRSEDKIARWEVTGSSETKIKEVREEICALIDKYVADGQAEYV